MRTEKEVQKAHDLLTGILITKYLKDELDEELRDILITTCDVLCWVLVHEHNQAFANNLKRFEEWTALHGYKITPVQ